MTRADDTEPSGEPDFDRLQALSAEMQRLQKAGQWDLAAWQRIVDEAATAAGDEGWMLEAFLNHKPS